MKIHRLKTNNGFTIVELMIALSVLSVILIMSTVIMVSISALYSKGVNAASLQNATRNISADLTSSLQFSTDPPAPCTTGIELTCPANPVNSSDHVPRNYTAAGGVDVNVYAFCIGTVRYSYVLNRELGTDPNDSSLGSNNVTPHVLWRDSIRPSATCQPLNLSLSDIPTDSSTSDPAGTSKGTEMLGDHMRLTRFKVQQQPLGSAVYKIDVWTAFGDKDLLTIDSTGHSTCSGSTGTQFCSMAEITTHVTGRVY